MLQPVVIDGIRTPIGKLNGAMKDIQPEEIAAFLSFIEVEIFAYRIVVE